jgi:hypothetical protein
MHADGDATPDDLVLWVNDTIAVAGLQDAATEARVLRLAEEGRGEEAVKLLEAAARPVGTEEAFWALMSETSGALGLDERAAEYQRRYDEIVVYAPEWPFEDVVSTVRSAASVRDGFSAIVDVCAERWPAEDWSRFRALELEPDVARLRRWLESLLVDNPPGTDARVLWFGVCNPIRDGRAAADLTVRGFAGDPERAAISWEPANAEARSSALAHIHALVGARGAAEDDEADAEYALCLAYAGLAVRTLASELAPELFLGHATRRELCFGFEDGDVVRLGTIANDGLRLYGA